MGMGGGPGGRGWLSIRGSSDIPDLVAPKICCRYTGWPISNRTLGKRRPNPISFCNPMKADKREAYQSSTVGIFSFFGPLPWILQKIITYMVKADFLLLKHNNNFWNNKVWKKKEKKSSTPYPQKMAVFAEKNYVFSPLSKKINLVLINAQKLIFRDF